MFRNKEELLKERYIDTVFYKKEKRNRKSKGEVPLIKEELMYVVTDLESE